MRKMTVLTVVALMGMGSGCSMNNGGGGGWSPDDWSRIAPSISAATEFAARVALQSEQVKPYAHEICSTMRQVATDLENFGDVDATFDDIRNKARQAVMDHLPPGVARDVTLVVVDQVLTITFMYARDKFSDFIEKDETRTVVIVAHAAAKGVTNACASMDLSVFEFGQPRTLPDVSK